MERQLRLALQLAFALLLALFFTVTADADTFPPFWENGSGAAVHFQPAPWPAADGDGQLDFGDWIPYTLAANGIEDNAVQDPSNGGTSPQNFVNVSSGCTDLTLPSVLLHFDTANEVLMFRWRVEQIAHTYAVGPTTQPHAAVDPWKSALWTVLIDIDGDGFREFAAHLDGSSGRPGTQVDRLFFIYSDTPSQSIDYVNDPDIHLLGHNSTAFVDGPPPDGFGTNNILNFQNSVSATPVWFNGNGETLWDYGTTRARKLDQFDSMGNFLCTEYFVDYQIPIAALDATAVGGPQVTTDTPLCLLMSTSNSLQNPLQKDVIFEGEFCADPDEPAPFGDCFTTSGGIDLDASQQPIVHEIGVVGCSPTLTAQVSDAMSSPACGSPLDSTVMSVDFYIYQDLDANGQPDDATGWNLLTAATEVAGTLGTWTATPDTSLLRTGSYLIGVRAQDDTFTRSGGAESDNITWSHLDSAGVIAQEGAIDPDFPNPSPDPGVVFSQFINSCGTAPSVLKSASASEVPVGNTVDFTLTVTASLADSLTVNQIDDALPAGWTFVDTIGGSLAPDCVAVPADCPTAGASGLLSWNVGGIVLPAGGSGDLIFRAQAPAFTGTFSNLGTALTEEGPITSNAVEVAVGAPVLNISKDADVLQQTPGNNVTFTITYANDSPVSVTGAVITDPIPLGFTFVSATGGGTHDGGSPGTVTWNVGNLAAGDGPFTVSFTAVVDNPFPGGAEIPVVNTATITSNESAPASADQPVFINLPLKVQKEGSASVLAPGAQVTYTLRFLNTGNTTANNATLTDTLPPGFTFVSAPANPPFPGGVFDGMSTVTWSLGALAPGVEGTVQLTLQAANPFPAAVPNPATNTVTLAATGLSPVSDDYRTGVSQSCTAPTTFFFKNSAASFGTAFTPEFFATGTAPTSPTATLASRSAVGSTAVVLASFFQDPPVAANATFSQAVVATIFVDKSGSPPAEFTVELRDFDPATGTSTVLGSNLGRVTGNATNRQLTLNLGQPTQTVLAGHRLLWVVRGRTDSNNNTNNLALRFDGTPSNSRSDICFTDVDTVLNKQVAPLSAVAVPAPPTTLTYTLQFGSSGTGVVTAATITDTLPAGVTYLAGSTLLNGAPAPDPAISGSTLTFPVNGNGNPAGTISGGNSGVLRFQVTIDFPVTATGTTLLNQATLSTAEAADTSDQASTVLRRPNLAILKDAAPTLLNPGDVTTFTLTLANFGNANATNIVVTDDFPDQPYLVLVGGSCTVDTTNAPTTTSATCSEAATDLTINADLLALGESIVVTFQMRATTTPLPPPGLTMHDNSATIDSTETEPVVSETVTVTTSTNPNLELTLTQSPATGPLAAGDTITYTITVTNTGSADALDVLVSDPVPLNTSYVLGSMTFEGVAQTDASGDDTGSFNAGFNQLEWAIGTLAPGETRTMTFQARIFDVLPNGTTPIDDTATAVASNTATKQATVSIDAVAMPVFTFTKASPPSMPRPITTLPAKITAVTMFNVVDATLLAVNDFIEVGGTTAQITAISGNTLTVDTPVSGNNNAPVNPVIPYTIRFRNTGDAVATNVTITDPLPANSTFVTADNGGVHDGGSPGTVTWTIGSVAPGAGGSVRFFALPTQNGSFPNTATLSSTETAPQDASSTTDVGVIEPTKVTSTPSVINDGSGATATYTLTIDNNSPTTATNVQVTDTFEAGFTFLGNVTINLSGPGGAGSRTSTVDPTTGDNPAVWCCWTLNAGATLEITFDAQIDGTVGSGTYQNDIAVTSDNVSALEFDELQTTDEDVTVSFIGPNHVVLSRFLARPAAEGVEVLWETDAETGTAGFHLLRLQPGLGFEPLHDGLLPGVVARHGGVYRFLDREAPASGPSTYILLELEDSGARRVYGPFTVDPSVSTAVPITAGRPAFKMGGGFGASERPPRQTGNPRGPRLAGLEHGAGTGLRIAVGETGLYRLAAADIDAALGLRDGEASSLIRSRRLRLGTDDLEVPWRAIGGGRATGLVFVGEAIDSPFTDQRIYRLELSRGSEMGNAPGGLRGTPDRAATFRDRRVAEVDTRPLLFGATRADVEFWFWDLVIGGFPGFDRRGFPLAAPGAVAGHEAQLIAHLQGATETAAGFHRVRLFLNGVELGEGSFAGTEPAAVELTVPAGLLQEGHNEVEVLALSDPAVPVSVVMIDRFELEYERDYLARGGALIFDAADHDHLVIDGFDEPDILLLDVTDPRQPSEVRGAEIAPGFAGAFQVSFSPRGGQRFLAATGEGARAPVALAVDRPSTLLSADNATDNLVITHASLLDAAERLAEHHRRQGTRTMVVDLDDVMDEFNGGQFDPRALRDFLAFAYHQWLEPPRYVTLAGEGTVDYKDALGFANNLVPPLLVVEPRSGLLPSDNRLADVEGDDGVPEMAVGRIPASTPAELDAYIDKIVAYASAAPGDWSRRVILLADPPDDTGHYTFESERIAERLPAGLLEERIYLAELSGPQARARFLELVDDGALLVSFVGHGGLTTMSKSGLVGPAEVAGLTNGERLPVVSAMACHLGNFSLPGFPSLGEDLVLHPDGGAAAVWSAAALSFNPRRVHLGRELATALREGHSVLGDAVLLALERARSVSGAFTLESQILLGDPALRIRLPSSP